MKKIALLFVALIAITGCTSQQTASTTDTVAKLCQAAAPLIPAANVAATAVTDNAQTSLGKYLTASCNANGAIADALVPNVTPQTPVWLTNLINDFAVASQIAAPLLPALLAII